VPLLVAVGALLGPSLADRVGWRWTYACIAGGAAIAAVAVSVVFADTSVRALQTDGPVVPAGIWRYPVACCLLLIGSQPVFSWTVSYLVDERAVAKSTAGAIVAGGSLTGVVAMVVTGRLSDRLGPARRRPLVAGLAAVVGVATLLIAVGTSVAIGWVVVLVCVALAAQLAAIGTMHASLVDVAPLAVGRASGITMTGYYLGALVAPVLFGALADGPGYSTAWLVCAFSAFGASAAFVATTAITGPTASPALGDQAALKTIG
jgi:CP family cyanate transporter-like MFS transporter